MEVGWLDGLIHVEAHSHATQLERIPLILHIPEGFCESLKYISQYSSIRDKNVDNVS